MALAIKNNGPYLVSVTGYKADPGETEVIIPDGVTQICERRTRHYEKINS